MLLVDVHVSTGSTVPFMLGRLSLIVQGMSRGILTGRTYETDIMMDDKQRADVPDQKRRMAPMDAPVLARLGMGRRGETYQQVTSTVG